MVGWCSISLFSNGSFIDRSKPAWHCVLVMPTKVRSTAFWSRLFYDTCENGRVILFLIVSKGFIFRLVRASPAPACEADHRPSRRNPVETIQRRVEVRLHQDTCPSPAGARSNAAQDRPSAVPPGRGADRNPQHRILVAAILRRVREWSDGAPPPCRQTIWSLTRPGPCGIACSRYRPKFGQAHFGRDYFTTHAKMVDQCPSALSSNDFRPDRFGLPRRRLLAKSTIVPPVAIRLRPFSGTRNSVGVRTFARACADLVEWRAGQAVRGSTWSRGRPESAASHSGRGHSTTHAKMVGWCPSALSTNDLFSDRPELSSDAPPGRPEFA